MEVTTVNLVQGSPEWHEFRRGRLNASEASAVVGLSSYTTRTELLRIKKTGITPEVNEFTQRIFDLGHEYERKARSFAESIIGEELFPTTYGASLDGLKLGASLDGITMLGDVTWEHKSLNAKLREYLSAGRIPEEYHHQMEQGLMLSGAEKCLFMSSNGNIEDALYAWYYPNMELRELLIRGWKQFVIDLESFDPSVTEPEKIIGKTPEALPALRVEVTGMVTASNLSAFKVAAQNIFDSIKTDLQTDEDFADADATGKWLKQIEDRLEATKENALAQTSSIDELFRVIDGLKEEARQKRLNLEKSVKSRKEAIRSGLVSAVMKELQEHAHRLDDSLEKPWMPEVQGDWNSAVKGKKTVASIKNALDVELAQCKVKADMVRDRIYANRMLLKSGEHDLFFLFQHDFARIATMEPEAFSGVLLKRQQEENDRIAEQKRREEIAENARKAVELEKSKIAEALNPDPAMEQQTAQEPVAISKNIQQSQRPQPQPVSSAGEKLRAQIHDSIAEMSNFDLIQIMEFIAKINSQKAA